MAEQPNDQSGEGRAPARKPAASSPAESAVTQSPSAPGNAGTTPASDDAQPPVEAFGPDDQDRGGVAYWRERAGRLGTTPHHVVGALAHLPADATFSEEDVTQLVREFAQREERPL